MSAVYPSSVPAKFGSAARSISRSVTTSTITPAPPPLLGGLELPLSLLRGGEPGCDWSDGGGQLYLDGGDLGAGGPDLARSLLD